MPHASSHVSSRLPNTSPLAPPAAGRPLAGQRQRRRDRQAPQDRAARRRLRGRADPGARAAGPDVAEGRVRPRARPVWRAAGRGPPLHARQDQQQDEHESAARRQAGPRDTRRVLGDEHW